MTKSRTSSAASSSSSAAAKATPARKAAASARRRRPVELGKGRGDVRKAVDAALAEARREDRMSLEHEVRALVACRLADVIDRAARESDASRLQSASDDLLEVLDTLPIRRREGESAGGGARATVLSIMDAPPSKDSAK